MKRLAVLVAVGMVVGAGLASAQIANSVHDFSDGAGVMSDTWNHSTNSAGAKQICGPCHHPHSPNNASQPPPLWDHVSSTGGSYQEYADPQSTIDGVIDNTMNAQSLACMSCHDGTINVDAFGDEYASGNSTPINGALQISQDMRLDHPIGITYTPGETAGDLKDSATTAYDGKFIDDFLYNDKVECATCHDVHGTGNDSLLRESLAASAICLKCHDK